MPKSKAARRYAVVKRKQVPMLNRAGGRMVRKRKASFKKRGLI